MDHRVERIRSGTRIQHISDPCWHCGGFAKSSLAPSQGGHPHPDVLCRDEVQVGSLRALDIRIALMPSTLGSA
jgi:hypothetical protein